MTARHEFAQKKNNDNNPNFMKMKNCLALAVASGFAAFSLHAKGDITAKATLTETGTSGAEFEYSLMLDNTGSVPINAFWYGWILGSFDLPSVPTSITAPTGWGATPLLASVQFANNTGSAIPVGGFGVFTFDTTSDPTTMTTGMNGGAPTGDSVVYANVTAMQDSDQNDPGIASVPFIPTLAAVPDQSSTLGLLASGLTCMSFGLARRRSVA